MNENQIMTVAKLYKICKHMINEGKGGHKIYLSTGGYYDGNAIDYYDIDEDDITLTLYTPS